MTRTRRFLGGVALGYVNQLVTIVVGLWLTAFLLGRLGEQEYGLWLVAMQLLGILLLLDLGVVALLPRETAFATGRAGGRYEDSDVAAVAGRTAWLVLRQLPLVALIALGVWLLLPDRWTELEGPLGIVLVLFVALFPARILQALLNGLQDLAYLGTVRLVSWALGTVVTVALVLRGDGLMALAAGWAVQQVGAAIAWGWRLARRYPTALPGRLVRFGGAELRDRLARSAWVSVTQVANLLSAGADLLLIGKVLGPVAVVPYFCTAKVPMVLGHQVQMLAHAAQPALAELRAGEATERIARATRALAQLLLIGSGLLTCIVLVVNEGFVHWWVGAERYGGFGLTVAILAGLLVRHWNTAATHGLFAFAADRHISLTSLAEGIVTVAVTLWLLPTLGVLAAALGILAGGVLIALPSYGVGLARALGPSGRGLARDLWPWAWRFTPLATLSAVVGQRWEPTTLPLLVVTTLIVVVVYATTFYPLATRGALGEYVVPRLAVLKKRFGLGRHGG